MSTPSHTDSQGTPESSGSDFYELSAERQIQWLLNSEPDAKWGWVVFRCTYKPELDKEWETFKLRIKSKFLENLHESDAPDIAEKLEMVFIEDLELEGASMEDLKQRFRAWARTESPNINPRHWFCGSRYTYFLYIDEDALVSNLWGLCGHVHIVLGWKDPLPPEEAVDSYGYPQDNGDHLKLEALKLNRDLYSELDNGEMWYLHF